MSPAGARWKGGRRPPFLRVKNNSVILSMLLYNEGAARMAAVGLETKMFPCRHSSTKRGQIKIKLYFTEEITMQACSYDLKGTFGGEKVEG